MRKEVKLWRNPVEIAVVVEVEAEVGVGAATVEVVKVEEVDKVLACPAKRATLRVVADIMPRRKANDLLG